MNLDSTTVVLLTIMTVLMVLYLMRRRARLRAED
jgi:hypothetical protein